MSDTKERQAVVSDGVTPYHDRRGKFTTGNRAAADGNGLSPFVKEFRRALKAECLPLATQVLKSCLDGSLEGVTPKDQLRAVEIVAAYTVPKPKATLKVQGDAANPLAAFTPEQLLTLAGKKTEGENK